MTYPVDDNGNPRVDFVWGHMPMQPNDQRAGRNTGNQATNKNQNVNWTNFPTVGSDNLNEGWTTLNFGTGDGGNSRQQTFTYDSHDIATTGWSNYPSFLPNYSGDGDAGFEGFVPNLIGMNVTQVGAALTDAGLVGNSTLVTAGATSGNNGTVKSQSIPAGTQVAVGTTVNYNLYNYVSPANPIAGFNNTVTDEGWTLAPGETIMYLVGRTVKPTVGQVIKVEGSSEASYNHGFNVIDVVNNDSYNTGGTAVRLAPFEMALATSTSSGGTWKDYFA